MALGICEFGFQWYSCDNGFKGCCRVDACGPDQCPEGERTTTSYSVAYIDSSTTSSPTRSNTDDTPPVPTSTTDTDTTTDTTTDTDGDSTSSSTTTTSSSSTTTTTKKPTTTSSQSSDSSSSSESSSSTTSTSSSTFSQTPTTVWVPAPTNAAPNPPENADEHRSLSGTAIAGISVGGTVAVVLLGLILFLLIRRRFIQRRNNRAPDTHPFASNSGDAAAGFMADHPSWRGDNGGDNGAKDGGGGGRGAVKGAAGEIFEADDGVPEKPPGLRGLHELP
ncbi:hypothetical protein F4806DRAFT_140866 [Annulohypoxylon nitens]|nr:hypothetical protein F4806DRAFT_140866 [Annulohypoxylon nitens]